MQSTNYGLALRWRAAVAEMEATSKIDEQTQKDLTLKWRERVIEMVQKADKSLNYFSAAEDTPSIVSVRVKNPLVTDRPWCNKNELATLFKAMT
jgi:hypothetical protein